MRFWGSAIYCSLWGGAIFESSEIEFMRVFYDKNFLLSISKIKLIKIGKNAMKLGVLNSGVPDIAPPFRPAKYSTPLRKYYIRILYDTNLTTTSEVLKTILSLLESDIQRTSLQEKCIL